MEIKKDIWVDRYPHFCINLKGMTVLEVDESIVFAEGYLKIKEIIPECEEWDNCIIYNLDESFVGKEEVDNFNYIKSEWDKIND